ncbi:histidine acid phosphatase [Histomonas meleagridis]|uniref:histidine acid phosphatase n=1 Tax=Histomonas meleagridis TaxID=135588 RepID=UPI0035593ED8|nr:histidine acid phosphatase [Histomonas meleagridis]KAH0800473.1 histidine acid phosphatase [Histomonas meleagridis]
MLCLFSSLSFSYTYQQCVATTKLAPPIEGANLIQVQVIIRHGSRTPGTDFFNSSKEQEWICDSEASAAPRVHSAPVKYPRDYIENLDDRLAEYKPNCRAKDLLVSGVEQHVELGRTYAKRYVEELKVLPEHFNPRYVYVRATELDRTIRSAISFLQGMYSPVNPNEVINMVTDNDAAGILHPSEEWCSEIKSITTDLYTLPIFQDYFNEFTTKYQSKYGSEVKSWDAKSVKKFCSYILMTSCTNHTLPERISADFQQDCQKLVNNYQFMQHDNDKYRGVASSPLFREMFRIADEAISMQNDYRFALLSSHDSGLSAVLSTLGFDYKNKDAIPVRAHLDFELWEINNDVYGRFVYNGDVLKVPYMGNETFLYANLKTEMASRGYLSHCYIPEWA